MENFIKVDVTSYVKQGIENGTLIPRQAEKFSRITARQGNAGEAVIEFRLIFYKKNRKYGFCYLMVPQQ